MTLFTPEYNQLIVRQEGTRVLLIQGGRLLLDMPYDAAIEVAKTIIGQAKKAEEIAKAESVIADQAILMRVGANINLATNPDMVKIAGNKAAWDLRRYIPNSRLNNRGQVFEPRVIRRRKSK